MKTTKNIFLFILIFASTHVVTHAQSEEYFSRHDQNMYQPQKVGLKDLVVEIRIDKLKDVLNQRLIFGKIEDLHFKLYWAAPNKRAIEVVGMPEGFKEAKEELKRLAAIESQYLIPTSLTEEFKNFNLSYTSKSKTEITAIDPSYRTPASEVIVRLDKKGTVQKIRRLSAVGTEVSELKFRPDRQKSLLDSMEITSRKGLQKISTIKNFSYQNIEGMKLMSKIEVNTNHRLEKINRSRLNNLERNVATQVTFTNFQVNTGDALDFIRNSSQQAE